MVKRHTLWRRSGGAGCLHTRALLTNKTVRSAGPEARSEGNPVAHLDALVYPSGEVFRSSEIVEDALDGHHMDLHLYPTTLSRDRATRDSTRAHGLLFDHRHFTYSELSERLFRSESLPGRLIEPTIQTVFVRHSLTASLGEAPSPGLVVEYRGVIDELKGVG